MLELPTDPKDQLKVLYGFFAIYRKKSEFTPLVEWLKSEFNRLAIENMTTDGIHLYRRQGALKALDELVGFVNGSSDLIDLLEQQVRTMGH